MSKDTDKLTKINDLYFSTNQTSHYIDSLRTEMNKFDYLDPNNVEIIKQKFINNGIGDSLFNKVNYSYSLAIQSASVDTTKIRLTEVKETYSEETKKQYFGLNNPLGVNMILYGIQVELIKDGTKSLLTHITK